LAQAAREELNSRIGSQLEKHFGQNRREEMLQNGFLGSGVGSTLKEFQKN
jgi:hypothetical protein